MKISLLAILLIPLLSFGQEDISDQLSKKEKKKIDKYALEMCGCLNEVMSEVHPKAIEIIRIMAEDGETAGISKVEAILSELDSEEQQELLTSLGAFNDPEFMTKIEACDDAAELDKELKTKIDSMEGAAYAHLTAFLESEESCSTMKSLISLGESESK